MARPRLLVVDDEPGMLRAVERVLSALYDVRTARLPSQALEIAATSRFDIAILDVRMPEMDGFALMARLTELQSGIDVILMTGSTDERDARLVQAIRERAFFFLTKPFDRDVLLTLVERCVELRRLDVAHRAHVAELEAEMAAGRVFQEQLLPERGAVGHGVQVALHWEPSAALGGDFCDYVLAETGPAFLIADVSGHGASAAMLTGMVKLAFRAAVGKAYAPEVVMQRIAASSALFPVGRYVSALSVRIHPESNTLEYVNAGHPPGLILRADGSLARIESTVPIVHPALAYHPETPRAIAFARGDRLVLYTDGILEARNASGEQFGSVRLEAALLVAAHAVIDGAALLVRLRAALATFAAGRPLEDDLTLVVIEAT